MVVTPAHQHPTGVVLSGERRTQLLAWLRDRDAVAIEDDYDAEYRYDRAAVGALQGLEPDRVVYAGSASKTLAPALRIGWLVVPPGLLEAVSRREAPRRPRDGRIDQHALADFLARGELDRHLRRMRARYRAAARRARRGARRTRCPRRRSAASPPGCTRPSSCPTAHDEQAIRDEASRRRIALETMLDFWPPAGAGRPTLMLGYAQTPEPTIRAGIRELAEAVRAVAQP